MAHTSARRWVVREDHALLLRIEAFVFNENVKPVANLFENGAKEGGGVVPCWRRQVRYCIFLLATSLVASLGCLGVVTTRRHWHHCFMAHLVVVPGLFWVVNKHDPACVLRNCCPPALEHGVAAHVPEFDAL